MKLEKPNITHKEKYNKLINQWGKLEDLSETSPGALFKGENFKDFLEINKNRPLGIGVKVPAQLYFAIIDEKIVGAIDIRFNINHPVLRNHGGHIGYGISPEYRRKGYATKMLELGLLECKKLNLDKVLVCCYTDNIGSYKTIEKNGGILENVIKWEGKRNSRYWINIK